MPHGLERANASGAVPSREPEPEPGPPETPERPG